MIRNQKYNQNRNNNESDCDTSQTDENSIQSLTKCGMDLISGNKSAFREIFKDSEKIFKKLVYFYERLEECNNENNDKFIKVCKFLLNSITFILIKCKSDKLIKLLTLIIKNLEDIHQHLIKCE